MVPMRSNSRKEIAMFAIPCTHNFEDYFGSGYDVCLTCGKRQRSMENGVLTHLMDPEDGSLYPNPALEKAYERESNIRITLYLSTGEVVDI